MKTWHHVLLLAVVAVVVYAIGAYYPGPAKSLGAKVGF